MHLACSKGDAPAHIHESPALRCRYVQLAICRSHNLPQRILIMILMRDVCTPVRSARAESHLAVPLVPLLPHWSNDYMITLEIQYCEPSAFNRSRSYVGESNVYETATLGRSGSPRSPCRCRTHVEFARHLVHSRHSGSQHRSSSHKAGSTESLLQGFVAPCVGVAKASDNHRA